MSTTTILLILLPAWAGVGLVTAYVLARRGHDPLPWTALGVVLGPLTVGLAAEAVRRTRVEPRTRVLAPGRAGGGGVDVLVGLDGSAASLAALDAAVELLGRRIGRITLATVIDLDAATSERVEDAEREADAMLSEAAWSVRRDAARVLLSGRPIDALSRRAAEDGYDLLVVGSRGRGLSRALLGSTAQGLAAGTGTPVLIGGPGRGAAAQHEEKAAERAP